MNSVILVPQNVYGVLKILSLSVLPALVIEFIQMIVTNVELGILNMTLQIIIVKGVLPVALIAIQMMNVLNALLHVF
jgi:hypothetical protein